MTHPDEKGGKDGLKEGGDTDGRKEGCVIIRKISWKKEMACGPSLTWHDNTFLIKTVSQRIKGHIILYNQRLFGLLHKSSSS